MSTIYIFRHGQTDFNRDHKFTGWLDAKLTDLGRQQAEAIANQLRKKNINLAFQTRLSRSIETLDIVIKPHPECQQRITDDRLIERSYGDLSGHLHSEIISQYGQNQFDLWHRGWDNQPPHGESLADVEIRVGEFITDIKSQYSGQDINIAISAHGNSIRLFRKIMENATITDTCSWSIPYDTYFEYQI